MLEQITPERLSAISDRVQRLTLELNEPSGIYTVTSPDIPGLVTEGSTPEEILHNVQEALDVLFMGWAELGKDPPESPTNSPQGS